MNDNRIERHIELKAARSRVWKAITDHAQFGQWFGCAVDVKKIQPESHFSFTWHPYAIEPTVDYSKETPTLVEFILETTPTGGTTLTVVESGFEKLPANRRLEAFRMDNEGWIEQMENIANYVDNLS